MSPVVPTRTKTLTGTSALTAWLGPKRVLMRARYDKGREPTMAARDELARTPEVRPWQRGRGGSAGKRSARPRHGAQGCEVQRRRRMETRCGARDEADRSGAPRTASDACGKADPTAWGMARGREVEAAAKRLDEVRKAKIPKPMYGA